MNIEECDFSPNHSIQLDVCRMNQPSTILDNSEEMSADSSDKKLTPEEIFAKYKDDDNFIVVRDDDEVIVAPKFTDEDWNKLDKMIDEHPLFAKEVKNLEDNELFLALQSIKYDESAEVILEKLYVRNDSRRKKATRL